MFHYILNFISIGLLLFIACYFSVFAYKYWKFCNTDSERKYYIDEWVAWIKINCMTDDKIDYVKLAEKLTQQRREVRIFETDYTLIPHCSAHIYENGSWFEYVVIPNWEIWLDKIHSYAHEFGHICLEHLYDLDIDVIQQEVEAEYFASCLTERSLILVYVWLLLLMPVAWIRLIYFFSKYLLNKYILGKVPDYDKYLGKKRFSDLKMYKDHVWKFILYVKQRLKGGSSGQNSN